MNHPKPEEWAAWLAGELPAEQAAPLHQHLESCPACAAEIAGWQRTIRRLEAWPAPVAAGQAKRAWLPTAARWAAAAAVVLGLGFGLGRLTAQPTRAVNRLRMELQSSLAPAIKESVQHELERDLTAALTGRPVDLTNQFQADLRAAFDSAIAGSVAAARAESQQQAVALWAAWESARTADQRAVSALVDALRRQTAAESLTLRRDLETLASRTSDSIVQTSEQVYRLAASQSANDEKP